MWQNLIIFVTHNPEKNKASVATSLCNEPLKRQQTAM